MALFTVAAAVLMVIGVRDTVHLHLIYPDAVTRLDNAFIAWWNNPPRFRAIGFTYPPLQSVALLPLALLRPLATSLVALPLFSAVCAGAVITILNRTLTVLGLAWWVRLPMLALFFANPLFLDYGANGTATCLVMALLAAGLHNFCAWYVRGAESVRSLGFCGCWLAVGFLARYEVLLWLALVALAVALVRMRRGAGLTEILAQEAILLAPLVYIFLIWCGVSMLVGGGGPLSWITRSGAEQINGLNYAGRSGFGARAGGVVSVLWHTSPLLLVVPALLVAAAAVMRQRILLIAAAAVIIGAVVSLLRMLVLPNPELLAPAYEMVALVPMLIGSGWLISALPRHSVPARPARLLATGLVLAGLLTSLASAYTLMKHSVNDDDRAFTEALSSHFRRLGPSTADATANLYRDEKAVATFFQAAVYSQKTVLVDEQAFPGLILSQDNTAPYRTRTANGDGFWRRFLDEPRQRGIRYLVVANPAVSIPGYPRDLISSRYPGAYSGHLAHSEVIYSNPLLAVVQLAALRR